MRINRGLKLLLGGITAWISLYWIVYFVLPFFVILWHMATDFNEPFQQPPLLRLLNRDSVMFVHLALTLLLSIFYGTHAARSRVSGGRLTKVVVAASVTILLMCVMPLGIPIGIILYYWMFVWRPPAGPVQSQLEGS